MQMLDSRNSQGGYDASQQGAAQMSNQSASPQAAPQAPQGMESFDDDIPF